MVRPICFWLQYFVLLMSLGAIVSYARPPLQQSHQETFDRLDRNGNVTIKWDIVSWTPDGYFAAVTIYNFQLYRHIPVWSLGWKWKKREIIWSMRGAQATDQGNCSKFEEKIPHCCQKSPTIVDLLPSTPYNQQIANCCKGGVLSAWMQDPANAAASFQLSVGGAGTSNRSVRVPKKFTLKTPGLDYTCGPAEVIRVREALMTWIVTCAYSEFLPQKAPTCCVSLSALYNDTRLPCPTCSCGCKSNMTQPRNCVQANSPHPTSVVQCTSHMCPIQVNWHIKHNYKEYWRVKITVTNFHYMTNYSDWNLVVQHPNFNNLTQISGFHYKSINDIAMLWGIKFYNDLLMEAGPLGNVQSELLFRKHVNVTFDKGWAFPKRIFFNGDVCVMPPPDAYPWLPITSSRKHFSLRALIIITLLVAFTLVLACILILLKPSILVYVSSSIRKFLIGKCKP